ncbi:MAG: response regulator [Verrucomicrobiota bacterium]|jgi:putative nucleotidyltransferase with HDIG domain
MDEKRILFADADPRAMEEFSKALGTDWSITGVTSGMSAFSIIQRESYAAVVANLDLPELDGAELLNHVRVAHPNTVRFIVASDAQRDRVMNQVVGGHQFLARPFDRTALKTIVERSLTATTGVLSNNMRQLIGRIRTFPSIPSVYLEVLNALNNPDATTEEIGAIVAKDMAITTKLLQVLNSAWFSLPRSITDPGEAVGLLGFETVKSLVMTIKLLSQYDKVKPVYFSIDAVWRHSTNVARTAREMAMRETSDSALAGAAYTAGLMHDLGKVILAANFDEQYNGAHALAHKQQIPLWEVEKDIFGATHGEIGAYLFGLWGMPPNVIEAAAHHHDPSHAGNKTFSPLTVVHLANVLEYESNPPTDGLPLPAMDLDYLREIGLADRVPLWRETVRNPDSAAAAAHVPAARSAPIRAPKPQTIAAVQAAPSEPWGLRQWLYAGLGVAAVVVLLCGLEFVRLEQVSAKEARRQSLASVATADPKPTPVAAAPTPTPAPAPIPAAPAQTNHSEIAAVTVAHNVAPPTVPPPGPRPPPEELAFNGIKLQAIFFSDHPCAMINNRTLHVNEEIAACRVLAINRSSVTLEHQNLRKTLTLK